jgi:hypothetical protein
MADLLGAIAPPWRSRRLSGKRPEWVPPIPAASRPWASRILWGGKGFTIDGEEADADGKRLNVPVHALRPLRVRRLSPSKGYALPLEAASRWMTAHPVPLVSPDE